MSKRKSNCDADERTQKLLQLCDLTTINTRKCESEVFELVANKLLDVIPRADYVRFLLATEEGTQTHSFDLCKDVRFGKAMDALSLSGSAQQAAMRASQPLLASNYRISKEAYNDWRVMHRQLAVQSMAAIPLCVGQRAYGVITVASQQAYGVSEQDEEVLLTASSMLAPFAAMMAKQQQLEVTRMVLKMMLPARIVAMINEHLGWDQQQQQLDF